MKLVNMDGKREYIENAVALLHSINTKEEKIYQKIMACCRKNIEIQ